MFFLYPSWNDQKVSPLFVEPVNMNNDWVMKDSFFAAILPGCFGILVLWAWFCFSLQLPCWCKQITVQISKRKLYTIVGRSYNSSKTLCIPGPLESSLVTQQLLLKWAFTRLQTGWKFLVNMATDLKSILQGCAIRTIRQDLILPVRVVWQKHSLLNTYGL